VATRKTGEKSESQKIKSLKSEKGKQKPIKIPIKPIGSKNPDDPSLRKIGVMNPFVFSRVVLNEDVVDGKSSSLNKITRAINLYISGKVQKPAEYKIKKKDIFNPKISPLFKPFKSKKYIHFIHNVLPGESS
jgi:hypothetical protein